MTSDNDETGHIARNFFSVPISMTHQIIFKVCNKKIRQQFSDKANLFFHN
jgi:hypothetical protein